MSRLGNLEPGIGAVDGEGVGRKLREVHVGRLVGIEADFPGVRLEESAGENRRGQAGDVAFLEGGQHRYADLRRPVEVGDGEAAGFARRSQRFAGIVSTHNRRSIVEALFGGFGNGREPRRFLIDAVRLKHSGLNVPRPGHVSAMLAVPAQRDLHLIIYTMQQPDRYLERDKMRERRGRFDDLINLKLRNQGGSPPSSRHLIDATMQSLRHVEVARKLSLAIDRLTLDYYRNGNRVLPPR